MRLGLTELIFIFGIILIVFGPTKLPTLGKSMGEAIKNNSYYYSFSNFKSWRNKHPNIKKYNWTRQYNS